VFAQGKQRTRIYTIWGRPSFPSGATNFNDGFTAGSCSYHTGAAANYIYMSKKLKYHYYSKRPMCSKYLADHRTLNKLQSW
jgi:hypothetical protein